MASTCRCSERRSTRIAAEAAAITGRGRGAWQRQNGLKGGNGLLNKCRQDACKIHAAVNYPGVWPMTWEPHDPMAEGRAARDEADKQEVRAVCPADLHGTSRELRTVSCHASVCCLATSQQQMAAAVRERKGISRTHLIAVLFATSRWSRPWMLRRWQRCGVHTERTILKREQQARYRHRRLACSPASCSRLAVAAAWRCRHACCTSACSQIPSA